MKKIYKKQQVAEQEYFFFRYFIEWVSGNKKTFFAFLLKAMYH